MDRFDKAGSGLASIKPEGYMVIYDSFSTLLPFLMKGCRGVVYKNQPLSRKEYTMLLIKQQPYYGG